MNTYVAVYILHGVHLEGKLLGQGLCVLELFEIIPDHFQNGRPVYILISSVSQFLSSTPLSVLGLIRSFTFFQREGSQFLWWYNKWECVYWPFEFPLIGGPCPRFCQIFSRVSSFWVVYILYIFWILGFH